MQAFFTQPGVGFLMMLIVGFLAGYIAEKVTASDHGLITNIFVGLCGAFVGREIANLLGINAFGFLSHVIWGAIGATVILFAWRKIRS